jgi:hypothetical protein
MQVWKIEDNFGPTIAICESKIAISKSNEL